MADIDVIAFIKEGVRKRVAEEAAKLGPAGRARLEAAADEVLGLLPDRRPVAFIPARAGSKRIPRKNLAEVGGQSLTARAIGCARAALGPGAEVVVSTDDDEIAWSAREARCTVHRRPAPLATDTAQIEDAIADWLVVDELRGVSRRPDDLIVLLQPTTPFRRASTVRQVVELARTTGRPSATVRDGGHDIVFAAIPAPRVGGALAWSGATHVRWVRDVGEERPRSQDLDGVVEDGSVYAFTIAHFRQNRNRLAQEMTAVVCDRWESIEIDTPSDLEAARLLAPWLDAK